MIYTKDKVVSMLHDVMNLGIELRQDQLNDYSDKSGNEILAKYMEENLIDGTQLNVELFREELSKINNNDKIKLLKILVCEISTMDSKFNSLLNQIGNY